VIEAGHQLLRIVAERLDAVGEWRRRRALRARMRHALHAPLTTVQGWSYLLIEEHRGSPICDDLRRIDAAAVRLAKVSDSLEHLYRVRLVPIRTESASALPPRWHCIRGARRRSGTERVDSGH
jgi:signal transduction histidine kinase